MSVNRVDFTPIHYAEVVATATINTETRTNVPARLEIIRNGHEGDARRLVINPLGCAALHPFEPTEVRDVQFTEDFVVGNLGDPETGLRDAMLGIIAYRMHDSGPESGVDSHIYDVTNEFGAAGLLPQASEAFPRYVSPEDQPVYTELAIERHAEQFPGPPADRFRQLL